MNESSPPFFSAQAPGSFPGRPEPPSHQHYDAASIALHWASAILIALDWLIAKGRFLAPPGGPRTALISTHILVGLTIGVMLLARLAWRAGPGRRLEAEPGLVGVTAKAAHVGLYALIAATVLAGLAAVAAHGLHLFGAALTPRFDFWPRGPLFLLGRLHGKLSDLLGLLAAGHAMAALAHHVVLRDGVLLRMAPFLPRWLRPSGPPLRLAAVPRRLRG
jgi:cytochrome b561